MNVFFCNRSNAFSKERVLTVIERDHYSTRSNAFSKKEFLSIRNAFDENAFVLRRNVFERVFFFLKCVLFFQERVLGRQARTEGGCPGCPGTPLNFYFLETIGLLFAPSCDFYL